LALPRQPSRIKAHAEYFMQSSVCAAIINVNTVLYGEFFQSVQHCVVYEYDGEYIDDRRARRLDEFRAPIKMRSEHRRLEPGLRSSILIGALNKTDQ
jgi:hypothetical protein